MDRRTGGMTDTEMELVSEKIARHLATHNICSFTPEEQASLKSLLKTKKWAAVTFLAGIGTIILWMLKDAYDLLKHMIHWGGN